MLHPIKDQATNKSQQPDRSDFSKTLKAGTSAMPKINIASRNVDGRVNTALGQMFRRKKLKKQLSEKVLSRRSSRESQREKHGDFDVMETLKSVHDKFNYQLTYGFGWGSTQFSQPLSIQDMETAK